MDVQNDGTVDEVSWKRQHNYLTLVADHRRGTIVWGCEGAGEKAADRFFAELDPEIAVLSPPPQPPETQPQSPQPTDSEPAGEDAEPRVGERAATLEAISLDMGHGYAKSARRHAPQAVICIDPYVRHEALPVRAGCETPTPGCRGSPVKLRAA
jgi:hypothetical protein